MNNKKYYQQNKQKIIKQNVENNRKRRKLYPWLKHLYRAKARCNNKNHHTYKWYGAKGIKCYLTEKQIKFLWFRDKAYDLKQPSIDRINSNKNYNLSNCRFIELKENSGRSGRKQVYQYSIDGNLIKIWNSLQEIANYYNVVNSTISHALTNQSQKYKDFIWKLHKEN